jgi:hypothetical protein
VRLFGCSIFWTESLLLDATRSDIPQKVAQMSFNDELKGIADHIILQARCFGCEVEAG